MAKKNREELEAFAQKMHDEGAAGFAAGLTPWETWDDFEDRVGSRVWQGSAEHVPDKRRPTRSFGDRVLTAMTALAVATLAIGVAGVYINHNPSLQLANNSTQLLPTAAPDSADTRQAPAIAGANENVAPDAVTIPAIASAVSPDVNNATPIDPAPAAAPEPQLTDRDSDTPMPVAPVADEKMVAALEQKLASLEQQLANLEQLPAAAAVGAMPVAPATEQIARRDSDIPAPEMTDDGDELLATLEQLPAAAADAMPAAPATEQTARMDSGIPMPEMTGNGDDLLAMLEKLPATATGATPAAPPAEQTTGVDSDIPAPLITEDDNDLPGTVEEVKQVAMAIQAPIAATALPIPGTDNVTAAAAAADMANPLTLAALNEPLAPAAGTPQADAPAPLTAEKSDSMPVPATGNAPAEPTRLSQLAAPAKPAKPLQAAGQDVKEKAQTGQRGDWSINLASYTKQSTAEEMRGRFLEKGVTADQVVATVNGKTYFRLRVTGFASRRAALKQSALIKEKLGLKDAWITKQ